MMNMGTRHETTEDTEDAEEFSTSSVSSVVVHKLHHGGGRCGFVRIARARQREENH